MRIKKNRRYEMAKVLNGAMTKKKSVNELMKMDIKDFCNLWTQYCNFCEADDSLGDMIP